jgi:hypothetical protein
VTDKELRDAAVRDLKLTTVGYKNKHWTTPPAGTKWKSAMDLLAQIGQVMPPPDPPPTGNPIPSSGVISAGGVYSGSFSGTIRIQTTSPVTISNASLTNLSGGTFINAEVGGAVDLTLDHVKARGGTTLATTGRFLEARSFKHIRVHNCTMENTLGIDLVWGLAGSIVSILRNRCINIQGDGHSSPHGNFVQVREIQQAGTFEIAWNEVLNEYNKSGAEDIISIFKSAYAKVHDNYLQHGSTRGNAYNTSSQGTITMDYPDGIGPKPHHNEIVNNQMVDTVNGVHVPAQAHDNLIRGNRLIQDGKLPNGEQMGNGWSGYSMLPTAGTGNRWEQNVSGFVNRDGDRLDWSPMPQSVIDQQTTLPSPITRQMELDEWTRWQAKLAAAGVTVGA